MTDNKKVHVIGGGTVFHVRPHLALSAPAYGQTARHIRQLCVDRFDKMDVQMHLTKMAGGKDLETNADVATLLDRLVADPTTKVIFLTAALCDFEGAIPDDADTAAQTVSDFLDGSDVSFLNGKSMPRLQSRDGVDVMMLRPADKLVSRIRKTRKDIFLVAFKTTSGATAQEQYLAGLHLLKGASCNLVLANDIQNRRHMIITPEEARYCVFTDRNVVLRNLVDMAFNRSHLTFTQSTVVDGQPVPWSDERVPASLRAVVDYCRKRGAYKPFRGATVGHFAVKLDDNLFLTSIRKTDFNKLDETGLVLVKTDGPDTVLAYGAKPSVGGQSQRIVFHDHPGMDCIIHAHIPLRPDATDAVPRRSQRDVECGSHQCGKNTSDGLKQFGNLKAVMLDEHGPNIVFNRSIDPQEVIDFIERNFDLEKKTGGYVTSEPGDKVSESPVMSRQMVDPFDLPLDADFNRMRKD